MPPSYVKAYLKRSKNDANDAAAICEAVTRPSMRFVPTKTEQQQSGLMLHRSRQLLVRQRTMLSNAIRGHLAELGIISAKGRSGTAELFKIIADEKDGRIPAAARFSLDVLARQHAAIAAEIGAIEKRIHAWHRSSEESRRLEQIPGSSGARSSMKRRAFILGLIAALAGLSKALAQRNLRVVGIWWSPLQVREILTRYKARLGGLGWMEGRNVRVEGRAWDGGTANMRQQADELVAMHPDVIAA